MTFQLRRRCYPTRAYSDYGNIPVMQFLHTHTHAQSLFQFSCFELSFFFYFLFFEFGTFEELMVNGLQLSAVSSGSFGRYECGPGNRTARENQCRKKGLVKDLQGIVTDSIKRFLDPNYVNLFPKVDLQGLSWHQYKHIVAFVSAPNQVSVHDLEDSEGKDHCFLTGECQRGIKVLEWRPNGGKSLSVPCKGGICTWAASYPGNAASVRSGAASFTNKCTF